MRLGQPLDVPRAAAVELTLNPDAVCFEARCSPLFSLLRPVYALFRPGAARAARAAPAGPRSEKMGVLFREI